MKIVVTGGNSSVGKHLLRQLAGNAEFRITACIRSERAASELPVATNIQSTVLSYENPSVLTDTMAGADVVLHLAGILIESHFATYQKANVEATLQVAEAAKTAKAGHLIFISVVGADSESSNAYYRSKGEAEHLVNACGIPATVVRTPILIGADTAGGKALLGLASRSKVRVLGGGKYIMRPLDLDDLCRAIISISQTPPPPADWYELVGPEPISYRALIERTANRMGKQVSVGSIPVLLAKLGAAVTSRIHGGGISPAVIDVITSNENVENNADQLLGISLTSLNDTLETIINQFRNSQ